MKGLSAIESSEWFHTQVGPETSEQLLRGLANAVAHGQFHMGLTQDSAFVSKWQILCGKTKNMGFTKILEQDRSGYLSLLQNCLKDLVCRRILIRGAAHQLVYIYLGILKCDTVTGPRHFSFLLILKWSLFTVGKDPL